MTGYYQIYFNGTKVADCETIEVEGIVTLLFQKMNHKDYLTIVCELSE